MVPGWAARDEHAASTAIKCAVYKSWRGRTKRRSNAGKSV